VLWKPSFSSSSSSSFKQKKTRFNYNNPKNLPSQWPLLAQMISKDLGMDEATALKHLTEQTVLLWLGNCSSSGGGSTNRGHHRILGAVTVQVVSQAFRMSNPHQRSLTPEKAMLGVGILWTHPSVRRRGVATQLVTAARHHAIFGMRVERSLLAFSSPTQAGYNFAMRYLHGDKHCLHHRHDNNSGGGKGSDMVRGTASTTDSITKQKHHYGPLVYEMK
jgi:hypothetical protein